MNEAYLHILINHIPVLGMVFGVGLLIISLLIWKNGDIKRLSLSLLVLTALISIPTLLSGEGAEGYVPQNHEVHERVEAHEHAAEPTFWALELTGVFALAALITSRKTGNIHNALVILAVLSGLTSAGMAANTSHLGGLISHPEIER